MAIQQSGGGGQGSGGQGTSGTGSSGTGKVERERALDKRPPRDPVKKPAPGPKAPPMPAQRGKYLLLDVPNFNEATVPGEQMRSYLRLGAVDPRVAGNVDRSDWGEDLAVKAKKATRLDKEKGSNGDAQRSAAYTDQEIVFEDDVRDRDPSDGSWPVSKRLEESERIHTKGGWRDHSDGNRITTTRGDKVEVIRGNYKLVVVGRQSKDLEDSDPTMDGIASGFDFSGGEVRGMGMNMGEFETTSVQWVEDDGGRYRFVEKNQKGDTYSIYWGDVHEEFFGEWKVDVTGSETPETYPHVVPDVSAPSKVNPKIVSRTWAESIEEYTGSSIKRIPSIKGETWAENTEELTDLTGGSTSNTRIGGGTAESTLIGGGTVASTIIGGGTAESTIIGGGTIETSIIGLGTAEISIVGLGTAELSIVGVGTAELSIVGVSSNTLGITPVSNELTIGATNAIAIGNDVSVRIGNTTEAQLGMSTEVTLSAKTSLDLATKNEVTIGSSIAVLLGPYLDQKIESLNLAADEKKVAAKSSELAAKKDIC
jgi:hypothetical protein